MEKKIFYHGESKRRLKENFHRFSIMDPNRVADGVRPVFKPLLHPLVRESVRRRIVVSHFGPPRPAISTPRWQRRFSAGLGRLKRISCTMKYVHFPMFSFHTPTSPFLPSPSFNLFTNGPPMVWSIPVLRSFASRIYLIVKIDCFLKPIQPLYLCISDFYFGINRILFRFFSHLLQYSGNTDRKKIYRFCTSCFLPYFLLIFFFFLYQYSRIIDKFVREIHRIEG